MPVAVLHAGCKVNLNLYITGLRPNGWHELDSLFVPLPEPCDRLVLHPTDQPGLHVACDTPGIDAENNTLTKAYTLFAKASGFAPDLAVHLEKGIPHGAGLGGGSSDAASLLLWLNAYAPTPLSENALRSVAVRVGADVPFFLKNTPCRATGVGDTLEPCAPALHGWHLVLVCPPVQVSTPWAYKAFDDAQQEVLTACSSRTIRRASLGAGWPGTPLVNDFEPVVFAAYPAVRVCKEYVLLHDADGAVMSGSGAAVVGLFRHKATADAALRACKSRYGRAYAHALS